MSGHDARASGGRKKTALNKRGQTVKKRPQLANADASLEELWHEFRGKLDEIYDRRTAGPYERMDPHDLLDLYLRPYVDRMLELLLEEDEALVGQ